MRPAAPTIRLPPVKTATGSSAPPSRTTYDTCSGVWPGVCQASIVTPPTSSRSPSAIARCANAYPPFAGAQISAPVTARASSAPDT